ncbi:MAG: hypothetical protein Q8K58_09345 [Acidimicrobiales bacterium]|nr:hypothetical protein [Acidimicrobiales bacterium]
MPRPLRALAAASLVVALGAGCADDVSPGVEVGSAKVSIDEVLDEVAEWTGNEATSFHQEPSDASDTYPMEVVGSLVQQRVELEVHRQHFAELDLQLDDAIRAQALQFLFQGDTSAAEQALGGFSEEYAEEYVDDIARQLAVQTELGQQGYGEWRAEALRTTRIRVNPRFGSWDPVAQAVVGPEGPLDPAAPALETDGA